jgi:hypothetical protein
MKKVQNTIEKNGKSFDLRWIADKSDMWAIVETELENARRGHFDRIFPAAGADNYLKFTANTRNRVVVAWANSGLTLDDLVKPSSNTEETREEL